MATRDIIVMGASAGGLAAMQALVGALDAKLGAAVFIVRHFPPTEHSLLPRILARHTKLPTQHAEDGQPIARGRIYVAPAGYHMTLEKDAVRLVFGPKINGARPAIDPLFFSAARLFGRRASAVLLSGHLDDGVAGLLEIQRSDGLTLVQDPQEAEVPDMPRSALNYLTPDHVLPAAEIGRTLSKYYKQEETRIRGATMADTNRENNRVHEGATPAVRPAGEPIGFSCPECGGAMRRADGRGPPRFECHIGHALTGESLLSGQFETLERSIWYTSRTLKEIVMLARELAERARQENRPSAASAFETQARSAERHLARLQEDLLQEPVSSTTPAEVNTP